MLLYGATIFLGAFLLFVVQPMVARMLLPGFGGSAAVWLTALVFFQVGLLAGYVYADWTVRAQRPPRQTAVHLGLLALSLVFLPLAASGRAGAHPALDVLRILALALGVPYVALSATGPLLQAWWARSRGGPPPYRLYALSNLASMAALLAYPSLVEPWLSLRAQARLWSVAFVAYAVLAGAVAWTARRSDAPAAETAADLPAPDGQWAWWALPFCSSLLLLAATNHLTQNVAPVPLLWVVPLAVYLLSFILCFETDRLYLRPVFLPLALAGLVLFAWASTHEEAMSSWSIAGSIASLVAALFFGCMACHGELARLRPGRAHLTRYYVALSAGGAAGGAFVALCAPLVFRRNLELPLGAVAVAAVLAATIWRSSPRWRAGRLALATRVPLLLCVFGLAGWVSREQLGERGGVRLEARNFYGALRVRDVRDEPTGPELRELVNGTTIHGAELLDPARRLVPTTYYGPQSGVGRAVRAAQARSPSVTVGVVGLGAGVLASYCRPSDSFRFYELNPLVEQIARSHFRFLAGCAGARVSIGDGRLLLEAERGARFDVLALDAFSSDAIPVHLLTLEALRSFLDRLSPDGILAVHVSNRYLDLEPLVARAAVDLGKPALFVEDDGGDDDWVWESSWILVGNNPRSLFIPMLVAGEVRAPKTRRDVPAWTDARSDLLRLLK